MKRFPILIASIAMGCAMNVDAQSPLFRPVSGAPVTIGEGSGRVVLADVNRDGRLDLVTQHLQRREVRVHLGDGTGHFAAAAGSPMTLAYSPGDIKLGDVNGDGLLDLCVTNSEGAAVDIFLGNGSGRFSLAPGSPFVARASADFTAQSLQLADINEDGKLDIITTNNRQNTFATLIGNGRGGFSQGPTATFLAGEGRYAFAFGDLDGDGHLDVAIVSGGAGELAGPGRLVVLRGDGKGAFKSSGETALPQSPRYVTLGDLDGDGRTDIVITHGGNQLSILLNRGGGKFAPAPASPDDVGGLAWAVVVADVNRDKQNDLVLATENSVTVLLNGKSGLAPAAGSPFAAGPGAYYLAIGDVNQDGEPDVVASSFEGKAVTVLLHR